MNFDKVKIIIIMVIVIMSFGFITPTVKAYTEPGGPVDPDKPFNPYELHEQINGLGKGLESLNNGLGNVNTNINGLSKDLKNATSNLNDVTTNIFDLPKKFVENIIKFIFEPLVNIVEGDLSTRVQVVNNIMNSFKQMLTEEDLNSAEFGFAKGLWSAILPYGYSLIALFFVIGFCKKSIYFEVMNELEIYKLLIRLVFAKTILDKSYELLAMIVKANQEIVNTVFGVVGSANNSQVLSYLNSSTNLDIFVRIKNAFNSSIFIIIIALIFLICKAIVIIRQIELAVLTGVSPLFFATFGGEVSTDVFKNFLKNYVSVVAQTIWIAIALAFLMNSYISNVNIAEVGLLDNGNFIVGCIALGVYCVQAPSSVKSAIGGSGGGGFSITSITNAMRR